MSICFTDGVTPAASRAFLTCDRHKPTQSVRRSSSEGTNTRRGSRRRDADAKRVEREAKRGTKREAKREAEPEGERGVEPEGEREAEREWEGETRGEARNETRCQTRSEA